MVHILVTAGPTREYLDDVRFLSNGSTGRMGYALATAGIAQGHRVHLVSGPVELVPPPEAELSSVVSAVQMQAAAEAAFEACDVVFAAAAVADSRPAERLPGKPPKSLSEMTLHLVPNPDIAAGLGARKGSRVLVGFALEAAAAGMDRALGRAQQKLQQKHLDLIVVNLSDAVGAEESQVVILAADGGRWELPRQDKPQTAAHLVQRAVELWERIR